MNQIVDRASIKVGGIEKYEFMQFGKDGIYFQDTAYTNQVTTPTNHVPTPTNQAPTDERKTKSTHNICLSEATIDN